LIDEQDGNQFKAVLWQRRSEQVTPQVTPQVGTLLTVMVTGFTMNTWSNFERKD